MLVNRLNLSGEYPKMEWILISRMFEPMRWGAMGIRVDIAFVVEKLPQIETTNKTSHFSFYKETLC